MSSVTTLAALPAMLGSSVCAQASARVSVISVVVLPVLLVIAD